MNICRQKFAVLVAMLMLSVVLAAPRAATWSANWHLRKNSVEEPPLSVDKRAMLAMLSRWRPLTSAVYRLLRSSPQRLNSDVDFVSAETRANNRPPGQPLRWGR